MNIFEMRSRGVPHVAWSSRYYRNFARHLEASDRCIMHDRLRVLGSYRVMVLVSKLVYNFEGTRLYCQRVNWNKA